MISCRGQCVPGPASLDADGDDVQVALEIWDPSTRSWRVQEKSAALGGKGILSWNLPNPFDTWDAGRNSRFRFTWDDGQSKGTVAAVPGPLDIPVAPWYLFYGRYVLALVLVGIAALAFATWAILSLIR